MNKLEFYQHPVLSANSKLIYLYMHDSKEEYTSIYQLTNVMTGVTTQTIYNSINKLIELGYVEKKDKNSPFILSYNLNDNKDDNSIEYNTTIDEGELDVKLSVNKDDNNKDDIVVVDEDKVSNTPIEFNNSSKYFDNSNYDKINEYFQLRYNKKLSFEQFEKLFIFYIVYNKGIVSNYELNQYASIDDNLYNFNKQLKEYIILFHSFDKKTESSFLNYFETIKKSPQ